MRKRNALRYATASCSGVPFLDVLYLIYDRELQTLAAPKNNNTPPANFGEHFIADRRGNEKDKIMERIFAFLQYMYSVLLHANEPTPERRFPNREETVFSMADFSRYWQNMSGAWKMVVDHSSYPYQYVNVEVWYELPAFVCAAIRTTNHPLIQTRNSHGYSVGADGVTIYVDEDSTEEIRRKILRLEDSIIQVWAEVISILDDLHHPEIFKKPKLWAWWKAEVANFLRSAQDTAFLRKSLEPNTKGSAHAMDGWEFVGDKAGFYSHIVEIWAKKAAAR